MYYDYELDDYRVNLAPFIRRYYSVIISKCNSKLADCTDDHITSEVCIGIRSFYCRLFATGMAYY